MKLIASALLLLALSASFLFSQSAPQEQRRPHENDRDPAGTILYSTTFGSTVNAHAINTTTGALTKVAAVSRQARVEKTVMPLQQVSLSALRVAILATWTGDFTNETNACVDIANLLNANGMNATVVRSTAIDTRTKLLNYDVVVIGSSGLSSAEGSSGYGDVQNKIRSFVENDGRGVVATGWIVYTVFRNTFPDYGAILPVDVSGDYTWDLPFTLNVINSTHPVTAGVSNFGMSTHGETANAGVKPGAQRLANYASGQPAVAAWLTGPAQGRVAYLGPIYMANENNYTNSQLFSSADAKKLLVNAVTWAGSGSAPSLIALSSGNSQSGQINTSLVNPFVVIVTDAGGNPFQGASVTFAIATVPSGATGQSLSVTNATTGANGQATTVLTLGNKAGTYTVTATSTGLTGSPLTFTAVATAGAAGTITQTSGNNQQAPVLSQLPNPFVVTVRDAGGNPVPGVSVNFTLQSTPGGSGALLSNSSALTDANGQASTTLTLGSAPGQYSVAATVPTLPVVNFTATAMTGAPSQLLKNSGDFQTGLAASTLPGPLVVSVTDAGGNPIPGITVQFSIFAIPFGAIGQSVIPASTLSNASGQASASMTFGNQAGQYRVSATSPYLGGVFVIFTETATNPAPTLRSISPTSAGRGSRLTVTITGTNFLANASTVSFGPDITINGQSVVSSTQMTANITISATGTPGPRDVIVTNVSPGGGAAALFGGFTIDTSTPTSVESIGGALPDAFSLQPAYPNPFNPSTRIRFSLPEESKVKLVVYNVLGILVDELLVETLTAGVYNMVWNADRFPSGSYIVRFQALSTNSSKQFNSTTRVMLLK